MSHARQQISEYMAAALSVDVSLATVKRGKVWPQQAAELPAVGVYDTIEEQSLDEGTFDAIMRGLELMCQIVAQGTDGDAAMDTLNAIAVQVEESLGDERQALGILDCVPQSWDAETSIDGDTVTATALMPFRVLYRTEIGQPEVII